MSEAKLTATFLFSGYSDYWGGQSGRGDTGGCAFAYYGKNTTLRDMVDQWVEDVWSNDYDFERLPEDTSDGDIRDCILAMLSIEGLADYHSGAICEFSKEWMGSNGIDPDSDEDDDCGESPQAIIWIEWEICPDCNNYSGDNTCDGLCDPCYDNHYGGRSGDSD